MLSRIVMLCGALLAGPAAASQEVRSGDLVMHYSAIPTLDLQPEIARQYGLTRSASRALLNIAVRKSQPEGTSNAVAATVTAAATNSAGQRQDLRLREVREGDAIYYLAEVRVANGDNYAYEVSASVDGEPRPITVRFNQAYFVPR